MRSSSSVRIGIHPLGACAARNQSENVVDRLLLDIEIIQPSFGSASVSNPNLKMFDSNLLDLPFLRQWIFRVWD